MFSYDEVVKYKEQFDTKGYAVIKNFLDADTVLLLRAYYKNKSNGNLWTRRDDSFHPDDPRRDQSEYAQYSDPLIEFILEQSTSDVGQVVGKELFPTYTYSRIYEGNDELTIHTDRPSCEYSVTVHVDTDGDELWPIGMQLPKLPPSIVTLEAGDAVIYRGCDVMHWREPLNSFNIRSSSQFMLHYVDSNGPYAEYKYDNRKGIGYTKE